MTQQNEIIEAFRANGWKMTLGHILQHPWGYTARNRFAELRARGYVITLDRGETPSQNVYRMMPPDETGQLRMAI